MVFGFKRMRLERTNRQRLRAIHSMTPYMLRLQGKVFLQEKQVYALKQMADYSSDATVQLCETVEFMMERNHDRG